MRQQYFNRTLAPIYAHKFFAYPFRVNYENILPYKDKTCHILTSWQPEHIIFILICSHLNARIFSNNWCNKDMMLYNHAD